MSPYGMSRDVFAEKLEGQTKVIEYMREHQNEYVEGSDSQFPFMNYLFPDGTDVSPFDLQAGDPPRPLHRKMLTKFPEAWVPEGVHVIRAPVFKFYLNPPVEGWLRFDPKDLPEVDDIVYEGRIAMTRLRKMPVNRTFDYEKPLSQDDKYFEMVVKRTLEELVQLRREHTHVFLFHLMEIRTETMGYLKTQTEMAAHIATYNDG